MTAYISRRRRRWDVWGRLGWVVNTEATGLSNIQYEDLQGNKHTAIADTGSDGLCFEHSGETVDVNVAEAVARIFGTHTSLGIFAPLAGDMERNGLRWPVILGVDGGVVGANRLKAAGVLGWKTVPAYVVPFGSGAFRGM